MFVNAVSAPGVNLTDQKSTKTKLSELCAIILDLFPSCVEEILLKKAKVHSWI